MAYLSHFPAVGRAARQRLLATGKNLWPKPDRDRRYTLPRLASFLKGEVRPMNPWKSQTEIVKAFVDRGHPAYALAALVTLRIVMIGAAVTTVVKLIV